MQRFLINFTSSIVLLMALACPRSSLHADEAQELKKMTQQVGELISAGRQRDADKLAEQIETRADRSLKNDPQTNAKVLFELGMVYSNSNGNGKAESLFERALAIQTKSLGDQHSDVATTLNALGNIYRGQDRLDDAEKSYKRALAIDEKQVGNYDEDIATITFNLGGLLRAQNRLEEAEPLLNRALKLREKELGKQHVDVAGVLHELAWLYVDQKRFDDAESVYMRAISIREKAQGRDHADVGHLIHGLALLYSLQNQRENSERAYQMSLAIFEKSLGDQDPVVANCLTGLANLYMDLGRFSDAETLLKRVLVIRQKAFGDHDRQVAAAFVDLASACINQGRLVEGEPLLKRALEIYEKDPQEQGPDLGKCVNGLADLYAVQGRFAEAEPLYKRTLTIASNASTDRHNLLATSLDGLANLYRMQGRYAEAEPLAKRALETTEKTFGTSDPNLAVYLEGLASLYSNQRRFGEAEPLLRRALAINEKMFGPSDQLLVPDLIGLGRVYSEQGRYAEAESVLKRALAIDEKTFGEMDVNKAHGISSLGRLYFLQGRFAEASRLLERALEIEEKALGEQSLYVGHDLRDLAEVRLKQERFAEAEVLIDRAIAIYDRAGIAPSQRFEAYLLRARISWKLGRKNEALLDLRQALDLAEQSRHHSSGGDKERAESFSSFASAFEQMVNWQLELGDSSEALQVIERGRARSLIDGMNRVGTDLNVGRSASEREAVREKEIRLKTRVAQLEKQLGSAAPAEKEQLIAALAQARNDLYDQYRDERNSSPVYRNLLSIGSGPPRISQLQRILLANESLALVYLFGSDGGYLVVLGPQQVRLVSLTVDKANAKLFGTTPGPLTNERLQEMLVGSDNSGVVPQLAAPPGAKKQQNEKRQVLRLAALWPLLIPEAEREALTGGKYKRLIVVPDGPLSLLPFETLVLQGEQDPQYLLDAGPPIVYGPSLSVLYNLAARSVAPRGSAKPVLTVADPVYAQESQLASKSRNDLTELASRTRYAGVGGRLNRLPFTGEESSAVADAFTKVGLMTGILKREQATESSVRQNVTGRKIVHLACHGLTDQAHGNFFGALALTPGKQSEKDPADDGFLTLPEIYELDMKGCELAILSACETNYGPQQQGEGVWALSRGFLVSGARRVVASNWLVDDEAGARLISYYCLALADDEKQQHKADYAARLHAAKKWVRSQSAWKNPYYWSTFVLVGPQ